MRRPAEEHLARDFRVHALAADFDLLDVWRFPVVLPRDRSLADFLDFLRRVQGRFRDGRSPAAMLFRLRRGLGRLFGWDDDLPAGTRRADPGRSSDSGRASFLGFDSVHASEDEVLFELENATVHALMHIGRVPLTRAERAAPRDGAGGGAEHETPSGAEHETPGGAEGDGSWAPELAVYVRRKGRLGRFYMALIAPFRHYVVYPEMMRSVARAWPEEAARLARETV